MDPSWWICMPRLWLIMWVLGTERPVSVYFEDFSPQQVSFFQYCWIVVETGTGLERNVRRNREPWHKGMQRLKKKSLSIAGMQWLYVCVRLCVRQRRFWEWHWVGQRASLKLNDGPNEWAFNDLICGGWFPYRPVSQAGGHHTHIRAHTQTHTHTELNRNTWWLCTCVCCV